MATFTPLNVEPDDFSDEEVDFTRELQIEEALKSYQNALKLHSQGPAFYAEAEAAYNELFQSEIFTYPEGLSLSRQIELYGDGQDSDVDDEEAPFVPPTNVNDGAPSSLPQILYLSYKNHAQFILDVVRNKLVSKTADDSEGLGELLGKEQREVNDALAEALLLTVEAIDRDETDLFLWRQISRISHYLGSKAVARFCLESVLDKGPDATDPWPETLGVEESFAKRQLKQVLSCIEDDASVAREPKSTARENSVIKALHKHSDPCLFLSLPADRPQVLSANRTAATELPNRHHIKPASRTWTSCGQAILDEINALSISEATVPLGSSYCLALPSRDTPRPNHAPDIMQGDRRTVIADNEYSHDQSNGDPSLVEKEDSNERGTLENTVSISINDTTSPVQTVPEISPVSPSSRDSPDVYNKDGELQLISPDPDEPSASVPRTMSLPTRKRSISSAGLTETADTGRSKSKRIKARTSLNEGSTDPEAQMAKMAQYYESELADRTGADSQLFDHLDKGLLSLGMSVSGDLEELRLFHKDFDHDAGQSKSPAATSALHSVAWRELIHTLDTWDAARNQNFLRKDTKSETSFCLDSLDGLESILEQSHSSSFRTSTRPLLQLEERLEDFVARINRNWLPIESVAIAWVEELLGPHWNTPVHASEEYSAYDTHTWPVDLREVMSQMLTKVDGCLLAGLTQRIYSLCKDQCNNGNNFSYGISKNAHLVQIILENHIDIYGTLMKRKSSVGADDSEEERIRLLRWYALAMDAVAARRNLDTNMDSRIQSLDLRFLWSTVVKNRLVDPVNGRDLALASFKDLARTIRDDLDDISIELPNNVLMPEISSAVAEREIARLSTMEFFQKLFDPISDGPVFIIENLEPLLDRSMPQDHVVNQSSEYLPHFLDTANISFKLILWQQLSHAYSVIGYPPRVLACNFERIVLILKYLSSQDFLELAAEQRIVILLQRLRDLSDLTVANLAIALNEPDGFEFLDNERLKAAISGVVHLIRFLHIFVLWEDSVDVGQLPSPRLSNAQAASFGQSRSRMHDMILRSWLLQFLLWKEAFVQSPESSLLSTQDLTRFLTRVHAVLGSRQYCGSSGKIFLKLLKAELLRSKAFENWEAELSQVIFDLHGVNISPSSPISQSHGCVAEPLDRNTAVGLLDLVLVRANRLSMKDLCKSELKNTIESMREIIKAPKSTSSSQYNKRLINTFLKGPINPVNLYKSLQGVGALGGITVNNESAYIANKGWYFLLGHIALTKFKGQKRVASIGSTEELENAVTYFKQDLELDMEKWETWYRLGQVFDAKVEEYVAWSAEKMNSNMEDLKLTQRSAIHCYTMAVAIANRNADASFENVEKLSELYADFGLRIFASTREPFSNDSYSAGAFSLNSFTRHYSAPEGMYVKNAFRELQPYPAWQFAATLFRRSLSHKPGIWYNHYMLGKCLWKMHTASEDARGRSPFIIADVVITSLEEAIQSLPPRDHRHPDKDPTLEPHYKMVAIVHKLVRRQEITSQQGRQYLETTWYSRRVPAIRECDNWKDYVLHLLKVLRDADKSNWHHRIVARVAHVICDEGADDPVTASAAKQQMMSQIFTKTMSIQVWRPESERAGRHFVYTSRYVHFITKLCVETKDRPSLELLAKQIRKKASKFFNHTQIWHMLCGQYLSLLRDQGQLRSDLEFEFFKPMSLDAFTTDAERVDTWAHLKDTKHPLLDILREAVELKRLNNSLMKPASFEDLIVDTYATIFKEKAPGLAPPSTTGDRDTVMSVNNIILDPNMQLTAGAPPPSDTAMESTGTPGDSTSVRPRQRGVTKREIQRRAEALVITVNKHWNDKLPKEDPSKATSASYRASKDDQAKDGASSVPGSVHDSADDESELSDLEEAVEAPKAKRPMFPNLVAARDDDDTQTEDGTQTDDGNARLSSPMERNGDGAQ